MRSAKEGEKECPRSELVKTKTLKARCAVLRENALATVSSAIWERRNFTKSLPLRKRKSRKPLEKEAETNQRKAHEVVSFFLCKKGRERKKRAKIARKGTKEGENGNNEVNLCRKMENVR